MLLFCGLGILALSPAESLRAGGSRDPTETPGLRLSFVSSEDLKGEREKEKLLRIRGRGLLERDGPATAHSKMPRANCTEVYRT